MNRYQFEDLISEYIDNELPLGKRKEFEDYLNNNTDAEALVNSIRSNINNVKGLPKVKASKTFNDRLFDRIKSKPDGIKSESPTKWMIAGFTPIHASFMTGLIMAFVFISIQIFSPSFDIKNSETLYTTNEKVDDNAFRDPINAKDNSNSFLTDLSDDSLSVDSITQLKKDYSKKIQFVND